MPVSIGAKIEISSAEANSSLQILTDRLTKADSTVDRLSLAIKELNTEQVRLANLTKNVAIEDMNDGKHKEKRISDAKKLVTAYKDLEAQSISYLGIAKKEAKAMNDLHAIALKMNKIVDAQTAAMHKQAIAMADATRNTNGYVTAMHKVKSASVSASNTMKHQNQLTSGIGSNLTQMSLAVGVAMASYGSSTKKATSDTESFRNSIANQTPQVKKATQGYNVLSKAVNGYSNSAYSAMGATTSVNAALGMVSKKVKTTANDSKKLENNLRGVRKEAKSASAALDLLNDASSAISHIWRIVLGYYMAKQVGEIALAFEHTAEKVELLGKKMAFFTGESDSLDVIVSKALEIGYSIEDLGKIVTRFSITTKGMYNTKEMTKWAETLVRSARAAGTSTQELNSALIQLSQSFSAGRLMGDEYRSISENLPMLKQALEQVFSETEHAGVGLKKLSSQGLITTEVLIKAFDLLKDTVADIPGTMDTVDAALSRFNSSWQIFAKSANDGSTSLKDLINIFAGILVYMSEDTAAIEGFNNQNKKLAEISEVVAKSLLAFGNALSILKDALISVLGLIIDMVKAFYEYKEPIMAATVALAFYEGKAIAAAYATTTFGSSLSLVQKKLLVFTALFAGLTFGSWLRKEYLEAELAGIAFVDGTIKLLHKLEYAWDILVAAMKLAWAEFANFLLAVLLSPLLIISKLINAIPDDMKPEWLNKYSTALEEFASRGDEATEYLSVFNTEISAAEDKLKSADEATTAITDDMVEYAIASRQAAEGTEKFSYNLETLDVAVATNDFKELRKEFDEGYNSTVAYESAMDRLWQSYEDGIIDLQMFNKMEKLIIAKKNESKKATKGLTEAQKLAAKELKVMIALNKKMLGYMEQTDPILHAYITRMHDLSGALQQGVIDQAEFNKQVLNAQETMSDSKICEEAKKSLSCIEEMRAEYDEAYAATLDFEEAQREMAIAVKHGGMSQEVANKKLVELRREIVQAQADAGDLGAKFRLMWGEFASGIDENIKGLFSDILKNEADAWDNFMDRITDSWAEMLADMAYEALLSSITVGISGTLGGGAGGGNLSATQAGGAVSSATGGMISEDTLVSSLVKAVNGNGTTSMFASGNEFSMNELGRVLSGTNQAAFVTGVPQTAGVMGPTMPTGVTQASGFSNAANAGVAGLLGGYVAGEVGGWEGVAAGGVTAVGTIAASGAMFGSGAGAALAAMGPVGWAALAIGIIMSSGVLGGDSDVTPDLNIGGTLGGTGKGLSIQSIGGEDNGTFDPAFGYDGTFGSMWASTQHDAFDSEEAAHEFINGITAQFANMDNSIANALGGEMTKVVADAMGSIDLGVMKSEEGEDWGGDLESHYRTIFGKAMSNAAIATGNEDWNIWKTLQGDMSSIVYVTTSYVKANGELKALYEEMFDIHSRNATVIAEQMGNWEATNGVMEMLGVGLYDVSIGGVEAANALVEAAGGLVSLAQLAGFYFSTFYSAQEQGAHYTQMYADTITDLNEKYGTHISTSTKGYRHWTDVILNNKDASEELVVEMLALAPAVQSVIQSEQAAIAEAEEQKKIYDALVLSSANYNKTIAELLTSFDDNPELAKATLDLQSAMEAFGITGDAAKYSEDSLKGFIEELSTVELVGEVANLASTSAQTLVSAFYDLESATENVGKELGSATVNTDKYLRSLRMLGMTDIESTAYELDRLFKEVEGFDLSLTMDDIGVGTFQQSMIELTGSFSDWGVNIKDLGFTADMTSDEIIAFTESLIKNGVSIDDSIESIYEWASATKKIEDDFDKAVEASNEFSDSMRELAFQLNNETALDNTIRQINELMQEFGLVGNHATYTSGDLADLIVTLDGMDKETLDAEGSINQLASAMMNLDDAVLEAQATIDSILSDQRMEAINEQIRLEELRLDKIQESGETALEQYESQIEANKSLKEFIDDLSISDLKNQTSMEKMTESGSLFISAVASGDSDKAMEYATEYLQDARTIYASSDQYEDIFNSVESALAGMISPAINPGTTSSDGSATLTSLDEEKSALEDEYRKAALKEQNLELIDALNNMALAKDASLFAIIEQNGVDMDTLGWNLIGTLETLNDSTVISMGEWAVANEKTSKELATQYGVSYDRMIALLSDQGILLKDIREYDLDLVGKSDLSYERMVEIAVGQKWSTQELADRFGTTQQIVRNYIVDQLGIPLAEIIKWDKNTSLESKVMSTKLHTIDQSLLSINKETMDAATDLGYGGVYTDNQMLQRIMELSELNNVYNSGSKQYGYYTYTRLDTANSYLKSINDNVWAAQKGIRVLNSGLGIVASYEQGTNYVPDDQMAMLHKGEAVIPEKYNKQLTNIGVSTTPVQDNSEIIAELKELKEEMASLRKDQNQQTNAIIISNNAANEKNSKDIINSKDTTKKVVVK